MYDLCRGSLDEFAGGFFGGYCRWAVAMVEGFNKAYGAAIEALRKDKRLRQRDVEGLTPRQVGRIESGQCRATLSALRKLAKAHGMSVSEYLEELSRHL